MSTYTKPMRIRDSFRASEPPPAPELSSATCDHKSLKPQVSLLFRMFFSPLSLLPLPMKKAFSVSNVLITGITRKADQCQLSMACLFWGWNLSTSISDVHRLSHHLTCLAPTITGACRVKNARISFYCRDIIHSWEGSKVHASTYVIRVKQSGMQNHSQIASVEGSGGRAEE